MDTKYFYSIVILFLLSISCQKKEDQFHIIEGQAQGSTYSIKYISKDKLVIKNQIDSLLNQFDLSLSTYRTDSKISKINAGDSTIIVDDFFVTTYTVSNQIYKETQTYRGTWVMYFILLIELPTLVLLLVFFIQAEDKTEMGIALSVVGGTLTLILLFIFNLKLVY